MTTVVDLEREHVRVLGEIKNVRERLATAPADGDEATYETLSKRLTALQTRADSMVGAIRIRREAEATRLATEERRAREAEYRQEYLTKLRHDVYRAHARRAELAHEAARLRETAELKVREAEMLIDPGALSHMTAELREAGVALAEPVVSETSQECRQEIERWYRLCREARDVPVSVTVL